MYIGRLFNSYGTLLAILKIQQNDEKREQLIVGLREIIDKHLEENDIWHVCQQSQWLVIGIKAGMNYDALQNLNQTIDKNTESVQS